MKKFIWLFPLLLILLSGCQESGTSVTILADGQTTSLTTHARTPAQMLSAAKVTLGPNDRLLYLGSAVPLNTTLPAANSYSLTVRRAVALTLVTPDGQKVLQSSALTVGQALAEDGYTLYAADQLDPPAETPIEGALTVTYQPSQSLLVTVDGTQVQIRSAAPTVGQALAEAGLPLVGLDFSTPAENAPLPADGKIHITRVAESVALTQKSIPYATLTEPSASLELDQQALVQAGEAGLAFTRVRTRSEDGVQVSQKAEAESIVRPPQDRILGYGTKVVIRTATLGGVTFQYYRVLTLLATSYSPCRSGLPAGKCSYGTASGLPVQRGTVAMVYSWYLAFGFNRLYIPGYGYATVGDVGGGPAGSHYWVDLAFTDADYQPVYGMTTVYFLTPVPKNLVYVLP
ncbi:MAG: ubiquitin-like domain-containing protein [Anaerolineales bacterium]